MSAERLPPLPEKVRLALDAFGDAVEDLSGDRRAAGRDTTDEYDDAVLSIRRALLAEREACAAIADVHWPEAGHVPTHPDAVSCPMSISILIRRRPLEDA